MGAGKLKLWYYIGNIVFRLDAVFEVKIGIRISSIIIATINF